MMINRKQRIFAFIAAMVLGIVILGALTFISLGAEHECSGAGCHVCEMIKQCKKLVAIVGGAAPGCLIFIAALRILKAILQDIATSIRADTLISMKVELLD